MAGQVVRTMKRVAYVAALVLAGSGAASALTLTGGPVYTLPGGGSCTVSGTPSITGTSGATVSCTGVNLSAHTNVYFGIRNSSNPNRNTMTGTGGVFTFTSNTASSITYGSSTSFTTQSTGPGPANISPTSQTVTNRLILSLTAGSGTVVATGGTPANSGTNGDIQALFKLTSGSSFTFTADLDGSSSSFPTLGQVNPTVFDQAHTTVGGGGDVSGVDLAFYYSDCGDGVVDSPETCDQGSGINGTAGSCCSSSCQFKANGTGCTDDGNVCTTDTCNGASVVCQHPAGNAGFTCRASAGVCDTAETCTGVGTACPGDAKSTALCRGAAGVCDVADFCNGVSNNCPADAKSTASCRASAGDCDLAESCNGTGDDCPADLKSTATCRAAAGACDIAEVCDGVSDTCDGDSIHSVGFVCNPGSGDSCDPDETCDGSSVTCPADNITASGTTCRTGSGDSCDPDETCTGTANAPCPSDVVQSASTVCRTGSGDTCDPDETCPGTAGQTCPADVVSPAATVCRAGSGDTCDPDEVCSGTAGVACPADVVTPNTTVCRAGSGDLCDPDETCPGTPGNACPSDTVSSSSTVCRASAGDCDAAENCSGTAGTACGADLKEPNTTSCRNAVDACDVTEFCDGSTDTCPVDALQPNNTPCPDGLFCNGTETCQSGVCVDQTDPCVVASICNESADVCQTDACPPAPQPSCLTAVKSLLIIKNKTDNTKDKMIWKFIKGQPSTQSDFADPTVGADYALCIYAGSTQALVGETAIPAGANWSPIGTKGFKYNDSTFASDGVQKVLVSGTNESGKTKALLKARGTNMIDPIDSIGLQSPVKAQLINYQNGKCWQGTYTTASKSTTTLYKGKQ
jgi:hypothetical protein